MARDDDSLRDGHSGIITIVGAPITVFLVDDDDDFREIARQVLTGDGYAVTSAADGGDALELLSAMADAHLPLPDVLVLDFVLPRLSGLGVMRAFSRICRCPPTLIVTGFPDPSVDTFARTLGAQRVLRKPIDASVLCAAVAEAAAARSRETRSLRAL